MDPINKLQEMISQNVSPNYYIRSANLDPTICQAFLEETDKATTAKHPCVVLGVGSKHFLIEVQGEEQLVEKNRVIFRR